MMKRNLWRWLAAVLVIAVGVIMGCTGDLGGNKPRPTYGRGGLSIKINWPEATAAFIPAVSQSVRVVVSQQADGIVVADRILTRSSPTTRVDDLEANPNYRYVVRASAHPNPDGTGTAQAQAQEVVVVQPFNPADPQGSYTQVNLVMGSTIVRVEVVPADDDPVEPVVKWEQTREFIATAKDANDDTVLVTGWEWLSADSQVATVDGSGVVFGVSPGTARIRATELESEYAGEVLVTVLGPTIAIDPESVEYAVPYDGLDFDPVFDPNYDPGGSGGTPTCDLGPFDTRSVFVWNRGGGTLSWTTEARDRWITNINPPAGTYGPADTDPVETVVTITRIGLPFGEHTSTIIFPSNGGIESTGVRCQVFNGLAPTAWPKLGSTVGNTCATTTPSSAGGSPKWQFTTGRAVTSSAAVGPNGVVYVGSTDGYLYALDPSSGSQLWRFATWFPIDRSSPAIAHVLDRKGTLCDPTDDTTRDYVYIGCTDGMFYAVDAATGAKVWEYRTGGAIYGSPTVGGTGLVYVASHDRKLYAFRTTTGEKIWEFAANDVIWSTPAIGVDGTVYITSSDRNLYALDGATGVRKWNWTADSELQGSPSVTAEGLVYCNGRNGQIYCVKDQGTRGDPRWSFWGGGGASGMVGIAGGVVFTGSSDLYALEANYGTQIWSGTTGRSQVWSAPAISGNGILYVGCDNGAVYAVNAFGGGQLWAYNTQAPVYASPAIGPDGSVYIGSSNGVVYAF